MKIKELYDRLESVFPRSLSCEWDNDGLMCCADPDKEVSKVMISLDATLAAVKAAAESGCEVLLTHHPMLFRPARAVVGGEFSADRIISSLKCGVSVMSFHTRADAADGGVNDCLVSKLGFKAAGKFGDEESPELGRFSDLEKPLGVTEIAALCKDRLGSKAVRVSGEGVCRRVCFVGGGGGDFIKAAIDIGADALVTGECSYNASQDAAEKGLAVIEAGHFETEFPVCDRFAGICASLGLDHVIFDSRSFTVV